MPLGVRPLKTDLIAEAPSDRSAANYLLLWRFGAGRRSACIQIQALRKMKSENGFRWIRNVAIVSRRPRTHGSGTGADKTTNQRALATAGQAADQGSAACPATNHGSGSLAFSFGFLGDRVAADGIGFAFHIHRDQANRKAGCTLELACRMRLHDNAADRRPSRDDHISI